MSVVPLFTRHNVAQGVSQLVTSRNLLCHAHFIYRSCPDQYFNSFDDLNLSRVRCKKVSNIWYGWTELICFAGCVDKIKPLTHLSYIFLYGCLNYIFYAHPTNSLFTVHNFTTQGMTWPTLGRLILLNSFLLDKTLYNQWVKNIILHSLVWCLVKVNKKALFNVQLSRKQLSCNCTKLLLLQLKI